MASQGPKLIQRDNVPVSWLQAEEASGTFSDDRPLDRGSRNRMPSRDKLDGFSAGVLSILVMTISVIGWSWAQLTDVFDSPWPAPAIGVALAIAIRIGGGAVDASSQAVMSAFAYLFVLVVTTGFVVWRDATSLYGDDIGAAALDAEIMNRFLTEPMVVLAWLCGMVAAFGTSLLLGRR